MPSAKQCSAQALSSLPGSASHRPLQQTLLFSHSVPSPWHLRGSMHVPPTQKLEQHSLAAAHETPWGEQLPAAPDPDAPPAPAEASPHSMSDPPAPAGCTVPWSSPTLRSDAHAATPTPNARIAPAS
jgi:hypothetical protein